jgi:hypothetical protein
LGGKSKSVQLTLLDSNDFVSDETFESLKENILKIQNDYNVKLEDIFETISSVDEDKIPVSIFCCELSVLEAVCKYLKEVRNLSYKEIGVVLNRSQKTIWQTYKKAKGKKGNGFELSVSRYDVPVGIFADRKLSNLEHVVYYLKSKFGVSLVKIGELLCRDPRTVWTVYHRCKKKLENEE